MTSVTHSLVLTPGPGPALVPRPGPVPVVNTPVTILYTELGEEHFGIDIPSVSWVRRDTGIRLWADFGA